MFLPESSSGNVGALSFDPLPALTDSDFLTARKVFSAMLQRPNDPVMDRFAAYVLDYIQSNNLLIPVGQIVGFSQYQLQYAEVATDETTTSTTYTDLATSGPTLSNLSSGVYAVFYGGKQYGAVGAHSSISVNGAAASDNDSVSGDSTANTPSVGRANKVTLSSASNSIQMKYRAGSAGTVGFTRRYLIAMRISSV